MTGFKANVGLILIFALMFGRCTKDSGTDIAIVSPPPSAIPGQAPMLKYLALGDSYTIGHGVAIVDRFPHQLAEMLKAADKPIAEPTYIARTGWTTGNLLTAIEAQKPATDFDMVTLLIGVNNQYQGRDTGEYRTEFTQCIQQAVKHARGRKDRVFVLSIPDYSVTPFGQRNNPEQISQQIDVFNAINARISAEFGVSYTNITKGSREALQNPALVAADGLHPSALEYRKWAEKLFDVVIKRI
jgi:lysophospholipase L1-like esterase